MGVDRLISRLKNVAWRGPVFQSVHLTWPGTNVPVGVRIQQAVLRSMVSATAWKRGTCTLAKWPMTQQALDLLQGVLPEWGGSIDTSTCTWPLEPAQYTQLAVLVPTSFIEWVLGTVPETLHESICAAVRERRDALGLPSVKFRWHRLR